MYLAFASAPPAEKSACSEVVGAEASALGAGVDVKRSAANVTAIVDSLATSKRGSASFPGVVSATWAARSPCLRRPEW